jgi:uroporphyrinogen decarboxylase
MEGVMNHRERILAAIRRQPVDRLPSDLWTTPEAWQKLTDHFNTREPLEIYEKLDIDKIIEIWPDYVGPPFPVAGSDDLHFNEWGMGHRRQGFGSGEYDEQVTFPLAEAETIADLDRFPWPSPEDYDFASLPGVAAKTPGRAISCGYSAIFYMHNKLRGLELSLMDPLLRPEFTHALLERVSDFIIAHHRRSFDALRGQMDLTQVTDDFGAQQGLLISPRTFDRFYRAPIQRSIDLAKSYGLLVFHHDDGDLRPLLPRLVEMGIDVLNPIQWRCGNWDLEALKAEFGGKICFHGGVDNQQTLPFGTPEDVRSEVRWLKRTLGADGTGFIIAPCHNLQAITPIENMLALYEAAAEG